MSLEEMIADVVEDVDSDPNRYESQILKAEVRDLALGLRLLRVASGSPERAATSLASRFPPRGDALSAMSLAGLVPVELEIRRRTGMHWTRPARGWWMPISETRCGIYVLCTERHALYVGQSRRLRKRLADHVGSRPFTSALVAACPEERLSEVETRLITDLRTPWNTQHLGAAPVPTFILP